MMAMVAMMLMALAVAGALAAVPVRTKLVQDLDRADRELVRLDIVMAVALTGLLAAAAIAAAVASALAGPALVSGQVLAVVTAAVTGGYAVRVVLASGGIPTRDDNYDDPALDPPLRGGRVIGLMERTGIAVSLLLGWPAGIAVILGIKGLARFPQLREHHASEQFILGTFASVLWACAAAGTGWLLGQS
ncbi:MAG: hypothetical protein WAW85_14550 [Gordonia sp. (in: high G+C Gram-positive bacteria)]|uniref:hypothetical protein n=1 Tax=Gordonia sp. (in: high G+C Gram-positive bacteria) TaxID=84139 RepID=UPI003BB6DC1C